MWTFIILTITYYLGINQMHDTQMQSQFNEKIYWLQLFRFSLQALAWCVCKCVRKRRRDWYCVSENRFCVCDHCGVTHATSGLEVFLMVPRFRCERPTIREVKALVSRSWWTGVRYYDRQTLSSDFHEISLLKGLSRSDLHYYQTERKHL